MTCTNQITALLSVMLIALCALPAYAARYFVSPTGSNTAAGTRTAPWHDIAFAACGGSEGCPGVQPNSRRLAAGDTLDVLPGIYEGATLRAIFFAGSGTKSRPIVVRAADPTQPPILRNSDGQPIFRIDGRNYIVFDGLILQHKNIGAESGAFRIGYDGEATGIIIRNCRIESTGSTTRIGENPAHIYLNHAPRTTVQRCVLTGGSLHGILLYRGTSGSVIADNDVYACASGIYNKHGGPACSSLIITGNRVYACTVESVLLTARRSRVSNNLILGELKIGANTWLSSDDTIMGNTIVNDGACITLAREDAPNAQRTVITGNLLASNRGPAMAIWEWYKGTPDDHTISRDNCVWVGTTGAWFVRAGVRATSLAQWQASSVLEPGSRICDPSITPGIDIRAATPTSIFARTVPSCRTATGLECGVGAEVIQRR